MRPTGGWRRGWFAIAVVAAGLGAPPCLKAMQEPTPPPPPNGLRAEPALPWDQPPPEFTELKREGFHAGVRAAIKDFDHHRAPDVEQRAEYRHPHVDRALRTDFRAGFRRGYDDAMRHLIASRGRHS